MTGASAIGIRPVGQLECRQGGVSIGKGAEAAASRRAMAAADDLTPGAVDVDPFDRPLSRAMQEVAQGIIDRLHRVVAKIDHEEIRL